jgi:hypothetical protein
MTDRCFIARSAENSAADALAGTTLGGLNLKTLKNAKAATHRSMRRGAGE